MLMPAVPCTSLYHVVIEDVLASWVAWPDAGAGLPAVPAARCAVLRGGRLRRLHRARLGEEGRDDASMGVAALLCTLFALPLGRVRSEDGMVQGSSVCSEARL